MSFKSSTRGTGRKSALACKAELRAYNEYRDAVQTEATLLEDRFERGEAKGRAEVAKALISKKMDDAFIVEITGLSLAEVQSLRSGV